jgi:hypothetical protein
MRRLGLRLTLLSIAAAAGLSGALAQAATASSAKDAPILTKTKAECAAEYKANIEAIKVNGQSKAAFDADCRAGTEKIKPAAKP